MGKRTKSDFIQSLETTNLDSLEYAKQFYDAVDELSYRYTIGQVFQDFLEMTVCGFHTTNFRYRLQAVDVENERHYFKIIKPYNPKELKTLSEMAGYWFGYCQKEPFNDFLGNFFTFFVSNGEHGQFFTPRQIVEFMVLSTFESYDKTHESDEPLRILDPACGSGRFLVRAGKSRPNELYFGQDLDRKCCLMTVLNLFANGLRGEVVWGDTLVPTEERTWDCWNINTVGKGIHRIPIADSYIFQSQQNLMARNRAEKQKPKIDFGKIDLPSEHRQKPVGKTVQSGLF